MLSGKYVIYYQQLGDLGTVTAWVGCILSQKRLVYQTDQLNVC